MSFAAAVATPTQADRIAALKAQAQALIKENIQLKERPHKVEEAQATENESLHTGVKEVQTIKTMQAAQKEDQKATYAKIDKKVEAAMQERKLQDSLSLKVRIGRLPPSPWSEEAKLEEAIDKLTKILEPINIESDTISSLDDTGRVPVG